MNNNKKPVLVVTRKLPNAVEVRIARNFDAVLNSTDELYGADQLIDTAQGADAILICSTEKLTGAIIKKLPETVQIIATFSVGYDHIDVGAAADRNIVITNTPDVLSDATAEIAMLLLVGAARGAHWGERMVRDDRWDVWSAIEPLGVQVTGKRLGILGMGRIGRALAKRARGFDMEIHYHGRNRLDSDYENGATFHVELENFLEQSDFLSIHCASTPETRGLINADTISKLPHGAIVVNTARGDIVNDDDLIAALNSGKLAAAGLDVFNNEPKIDPRYRDMENVFLLPHLGSATLETRDAMGFRALDNLEAFFAGKTPGDIVKP